MKRSRQKIVIHKNILRVGCLLLALIAIASLILSVYNTFFTWVFGAMMILYPLSLAPIIDTEANNKFDYLLYFILMIMSLSVVAVLVTAIPNMIFHNTDVNIYFGITSFFTFSYLYDIYFREMANQHKISWLKTDLLKGLYVMSARVSVGIGKTCNIFRLVLLVLSVFTHANVLRENIENLPFANIMVSDAIVTSLAVEKLIKSFYNKLGTKVDYNDD